MQQYSIGYETTYLSDGDINQINVIKNLEIDYANDDLFLDKLFRKYIGVEDVKMKQLYAKKQHSKSMSQSCLQYVVPYTKTMKQRPASYVTYQLAKKQQKKNEFYKAQIEEDIERHHKTLQEVLYEEGRKRKIKKPPTPPRQVQKPINYR